MTPTRSLQSLAHRALIISFAAGLLVAPSAAAQDDQPAPTPPAAEELNLVNLPTTMSLGRHQSYFRLTHRFARDLRRGDFGSLAEDLFSLDNGAVIGLEYRFGITSNIQAGVHRTTLSKTIQFFGKYDAWHQSESMPVSISVLGSVEGLANFHQNYQPGVGVTVARSIGSALAVYATPTFVAHTQAADTLSHDGHDHEIPGQEDEHAQHDDTTFVGLGARFRILPTAFVVVEVAPRVSGHDPGRADWGVAIEKRTAGHTLQLNFSNSFGTTLGEIARGGSTHDVYLGFNLIRRF
jgi:hypothetical protein